MRGAPAVDQPVDFVAPGIAPGVIGQAGIVGQIGATDGQHEAPENGIAVGADGDVARVVVARAEARDEDDRLHGLLLFTRFLGTPGGAGAARERDSGERECSGCCGAHEAAA